MMKNMIKKATIQLLILTLSLLELSVRAIGAVGATSPAVKANYAAQEAPGLSGKSAVIAAANKASGTVEGYLKSIDDTSSTIQIEDYDGRVYVYSFRSTTIFEIDQVPVTKDDFKPGMEVYANINQNVITYMEGYSTENLGVIPPGSRVRSGIISRVDRNQLIVKLPDGKEEIYFTSPATIVIKGGQNVSPSVLYEGDSIRMFFDEPNSNIISRITVQGDSVKIKGIYKGELKFSDPVESTVTLSDVKVFENGDWKDKASLLKLETTTDLAIFIGGYRVLPKDLKYYQGKAVYMAVGDFFGRDQVKKMVIKNQYESTYTDSIEDINWYAGALELANKQNLSFNDGTIFIKGGRMVDQYSINPSSSAFIVADGRGLSASADVVYVYDEDINNTSIGQNYLYAGRLDEIFNDQINIRDFYILDKNEWESYSDTKELYFDNDTYIFDVEEGRQISPKEFVTRDYAVDDTSRTVRQRGLKDYHAYLYTDGDRVVEVLVQKDMDSLLKQRVTVGVVESIKNDPLLGTTVTLKDARDWSNKNKSWMPKTLPVKIAIDNALMVKDNKNIYYEDIRPKDTIYCVRDDLSCKFLLVK